MMNNVMIDLETLHNKYNTVVLSIGAVTFDKNQIRKQFYEVMSFQEQLEKGIEINESTLRWWFNKSEVAREEINSVTGNTTDTLHKFSKWINSINHKNIYMWGNGVGSDNVWLRNLYEQFDMKVPWEWSNDRCYRTIKNLFPLDLEFEGDAHVAIDDAKWQAKHLMEMEKEYNIGIFNE